jgi:hypothetical protein
LLDFNKLKLAHDLIRTYAFQEDWDINLTTCFNSYINTERIGFILSDGNGDHRFTELDELIAKLQELTRPKPKFNVGDKVYFINPQVQINVNTIESITQEHRGILFHFGKPTYGAIYEPDAFPTKEALIDAQIAYWSCLKDTENLTHNDVRVKEIEKCEHKTDGKFYEKTKTGYCYIQISSVRASNDYIPELIFKCIKCGEFYK